MSTENATASGFGAESGDRGRRFLSGLLSTGTIFVLLLILWIWITILNPTFAEPGPFLAYLKRSAPLVILAAGAYFVLVSGNFDLSVGSLVTVIVVVAAKLIDGESDRTWPVIVLLLLIGVTVGLVNGFISTILRVPSFITTLGMLLALAGLTLIISHAAPVEMPGAEVTSRVVEVHHTVNGQDIVLPERVNEVGTFATIFGAGKYSELIWALVIVGVVQVLLSLTRWGMYTIAVGGNKHGAAEAGVKVRTVVIRNFIVCSVLAGFVGILEATRSGSVTPDTAGAAGTMFRAVSAAVIGGTLLAGGQGTAIGALFGALFLGILRDGLVLQGVNADYLDFILGVAILVAMIINVYVGRVRRGSGV